MQKIPKKYEKKDPFDEWLGKSEKSSSIDSVIKEFCQSKTLINRIFFP